MPAHSTRQAARVKKTQGIRKRLRHVIVGAATAAMTACSIVASQADALHAEFGVVDAAIVFAVDRSSSINPAEARLQLQGHAEALRSSEVNAAITGGAIGCIAVTYVEWSSVGALRSVLPWTKICDADDAFAAADRILAGGDDGSERRGRGRTSISFAVEMSGLLLDRFPGKAARKIVDISSNGTNNDGLPIDQSRRRTLEKGYVINGIAISREEPGITADLPGYLAEHVVGGPGSFVIAPTRSSDYVTAIRRKLVLEISGAATTGDRQAMAFELFPGLPL